MLSDAALASLRCAAALLVATPGMRIRLRDGQRTVVEAGGDLPDRAAHLTLGPCAFRATVARAHAMRLEGHRLGMLGLVGASDPQIDLAASGGTACYTDSTVRGTDDGEWLHLAAMAAPAERLRHVVHTVVDEMAAPVPGADVHLWPLDDLDVTLVGLRTPAGDHSASWLALDAIRAVVAACTVAELESMLCGS